MPLFSQHHPRFPDEGWLKTSRWGSWGPTRPCYFYSTGQPLPFVSLVGQPQDGTDGALHPPHPLVGPGNQALLPANERGPGFPHPPEATPSGTPLDSSGHAPTHLDYLGHAPPDTLPALPLAVGRHGQRGGLEAQSERTVINPPARKGSGVTSILEKISVSSAQPGVPGEGQLWVYGPRRPQSERGT